MDRGGPAALTPPPEESRPLTALRGVAALLVVAHHSYLHLALDRHLPMLQWLLRKGYLGVDLFFVLSGFVITMVYGSWFDGSRRVGVVDYLRFVSRRVARLWPVHAVVLVAILAFPVTLGAVPSPRLVVANLGMIQAWGLSGGLNPPAWSVSTELAAYLLFPFLATFVARVRWGWLLCAAAVVAVLCLCLAYAPPLGPGRRGQLDLYFNYSYLPLGRCLAGFTVGVLAFHAGRVGWIRRLAESPVTGPLALLCFGAALLGRVNDLLILAVLPILVLGLHHGRGPVHRWLGGNPLHGLGLLSYAIYLVHYGLLAVFPFGAMPVGYGLPAYGLVTAAIAALLYRFIETPGRRLIRWASERLLGTHGAARPLQDGLP